MGFFKNVRNEAKLYFKAGGIGQYLKVCCIRLTKELLIFFDFYRGFVYDRSMRILGIDYGDARIGLALSDETETIAGALGTYHSVSMRKDADYIAALVKEKKVQKIVLGMPLNMDGSKGERAGKTEAFGRVLEKITEIPVIYKDERLSTCEAERSLNESGMRFQKKKNVVDTAAAQIILQSYLDSERNRRVNKL